MGRPLGLVAALIAGFALFYLSAASPRPAPASAPASEFSAGRAMADIRAMGSVPHALGSPADMAVRDYLMRRLTALGLSTQVQHGVTFESRGTLISGGAVDNVIGILPGKDRTAPALALMAHHDSVHGSPGAADDIAGVASALEIVRAIKARGAPGRDVMLVITDGEEAGLLGARAFFEHSPLAAHVGYVINMETRGGGGRTTMFETAADNGADIALYRRTAAMPQSNALSVFVYRRLPNDTDFTVAKAHGKAGLNYAFIGRQFDYHSPSSTPQALDQGALQHMGAQILPTATALAFGPLPGRAPDAVYGNVLGSLTLQYPAWGGWLVLLAAAGLIVLGAWRARASGVLAWPDVGRGVGASLYLLAGAVAMLELVRRATGVGSGWMAYRPILARFTQYEVMMLAAALGLVLIAAALSGRKARWIGGGLGLAAGAACSLFAGFDGVGLIAGAVAAAAGLAAFGAPGKPVGSWTGLLVVALAAATAGQALAPTAAYVIAWPLLAAAVAFAVSAGDAARPGLPYLVLVVMAALVLGWAGGLFHTLLQALDMAAPAAFVAWLAAMILWPLAASATPQRASLWPGSLLIALSLVMAGWLHVTSPWSPRHPDAVEPQYVVDPAANRAWRISPIALNAWSRSVLTAEGGPIGRLRGDAFGGDIAAPAAPMPADPALVKASAGADGRVVISTGFHPGAAELIVAFRDPDGVKDVRVNGEPAGLEGTKASLGSSAAPPPFDLKPNQWGRVVWAAPEGYALSFATADPAKVEVATAEIYDRWMSPKPLPPMPANDQAWDLSGATLVFGRPAPPG